MTSAFQKAREPMSSYTHFIGAIASVFATFLMILKCCLNPEFTPVRLISVILFGISMVALYSASSIYHFSNEGVCSWYDFTKKIAELAGHTACDIEPCHSDEFPSPVKRPAYSVLDKTKIKQTFGIKVPYWTDSLTVCMENMKAMR